MAEESLGGGMSLLGHVAQFIGAPEPALRLLLSILLGYPVAVFHRRYLHKREANVQHIFFIIVGLWLGFFNYGKDVYHSLITVSAVYITLVLFGGTLISVVAVFLFTMMYLLTGYYMTGTETYDIKWTMAQCVLTLRLIGLSFDLYDGKKNTASLSKDQKAVALQQMPSILEVAAYTYFPASFLVGPQFPLRRYMKFVSGEYENEWNQNEPNSSANDSLKNLPQCWHAGLKRALIGFIYLGAYQIGSAFFPDNYLLSDEFQDYNFWKKMFYLGIWGKIVLYKYISCWLLTEGVCICMGLTYNGKSPDGVTLWDGCANVKLRIFEGATKFGNYIESFNINTNVWVSMYIYKRLKFLGNRLISQAVTLLFLAVWHGFHTGYYMCFLMEFIIMKFEKDVQKFAEGNSLITQIFKLPFIHYISWIIFKSYALIFMGYSLIPFTLLSTSRWMQVYGSIYFCGHIIFLLVPLLLPLVKALKPKAD